MPLALSRVISALSDAPALAVDAGCACPLGSLSLSHPASTKRIKAITKRISDSNSMWGGRFGEGPGVIMREINASIPFDKRLWQEDIAGSKAHADMLAANGIITASDNAAIQSGLDSIYAEYAANGVPEDLTLEDIHMVTETRLRALVGEPAARLHTARSRNDQVATDFRLYVRDTIDETDAVEVFK